MTVRPCSLIFVLCVVLRWRDDIDISHLNVWLKKCPTQFYIFMARVSFFQWPWKNIGRRLGTNQRRRCEGRSRRADCGQGDSEHFERDKKEVSRRIRGSGMWRSFSGVHDKHEDWRFKKTLLTTEDRWFGQLLKAVACLDREVKDYDIDDFVQNSPPEVTTKLAEWMNAQVYNVLTLQTKDNSIQTVARKWLTEKMSAASPPGSSCCGLTKESTPNRSQQRDRTVSTHSCGSFRVDPVLPRMGNTGNWEASLKKTRKRHR